MNNTELKRLSIISKFKFQDLRNEDGVYKILEEQRTFLAVINTGLQRDIFYISLPSVTSPVATFIDFASEHWVIYNFKRIKENIKVTFERSSITRTIIVSPEIMPKGLYFDEQGQRYIQIHYTGNYILTHQRESGLFLCNPDGGLTKIDKTTLLKKRFVLQEGADIKIQMI